MSKIGDPALCHVFKEPCHISFCLVYLMNAPKTQRLGIKTDHFSCFTVLCVDLEFTLSGAAGVQGCLEDPKWPHSHGCRLGLAGGHEVSGAEGWVPGSPLLASPRG